MNASGITGFESCFWIEISVNGAVNGLWEEEDPALMSQNRGGIALHNNWIVGREAKEKRLVEKRLWFYDKETTTCVYTSTKKETPMARRQHGDSWIAFLARHFVSKRS